MKYFWHILACAAYCYPETEKIPGIHLTSSSKVLYGVNKLSSKIQDKDQHWNEIQYKFVVEDDPANPSSSQIQEQ